MAKTNKHVGRNALIGVDAPIQNLASSVQIETKYDLIFPRNSGHRVKLLGLTPVFMTLPDSLHKPIVEPLVAIGRRVYELLPQRRPYTPLPEYLHQDLLASFMPEIKQLEMLLNRDLSVWCTRSYIE